MTELLATASAPASEAARRLQLQLQLLPLVLALLAGAGHADAGAASVCDTANCGKGNCTEVAGPLPPYYECQCDRGWSRALKLIPFSPCIVPNCSFNSDCLKLNNSVTPPPPMGTLDVCAVVSCGAGGACKAGGAPFSYSCECRPGYANLLNLTTLPCANCFLGEECSALGLGPSSPAPAPSGDHGSPSGPSAPPSGTNGHTTHDSLGSVSSPNLLQQLLLLVVSVAVVQVV